MSIILPVERKLASPSFWDREEWVVHPQDFIDRAVNFGLISRQEARSRDLEEAAQDQAYRLKDMYQGSGQGFGSSDFNHALFSVLRDAGFSVDWVNQKLTRLASEDERDFQAGFAAGPEGEKAWKAWFAKQPKDFQEEWKKNTETYGDKFKKAGVMDTMETGTEEAMYAEGENVPLSDLPEELQENVKNPPPGVEKLKKKMEESMMMKINSALLPSEIARMRQAGRVKPGVWTFDPRTNKYVEFFGPMEDEDAPAMAYQDLPGGSNLIVIGVDPRGVWWELDSEGMGIRGGAEGRVATTKEAAAGLYGYTKSDQRDAEVLIRRAQKKAAAIARAIYAKDERVASFLEVHAKRAKSSSAQILLSALQDLGPKVGGKSAGGGPLGLYGFPSKTARMGLIACVDFRGFCGEASHDLHSRRQARYAHLTGFLQAHSKQAKCGYSRMLLGCWPDAPKVAGDLSKLPPALREQAEKKIEEGKKNKKDDKKEESKKKAADFDPEEIGADQLENTELQNKQASSPNSVAGWLEWE